jgi:uncharacterized damage-inducible protein DinB
MSTLAFFQELLAQEKGLFTKVVRAVNDGAKQLGDSFDLVLAKLKAMDEGLWPEKAKFLVGDQVVVEASRERLAWMLLLDAIHHRGQLSTYLRPMGSRVPSIYGPSADEQPMAH